MSATTAPGAESSTTAAGAQGAADTTTTTTKPAEAVVADAAGIGPTGPPVEMGPTEACPSGRYVEFLGLLVCEDA